MSNNRYAVILAAGKGTRMQSKLYKVLHKVCDRTMVELVLDSLSDLEMQEVITVVGHGAERVKEVLGDRTKFVIKAEQLGTAHAVKMAKSELADKEGTTIVMYGDTPLIRPETINSMLDHHENSNAKATVLTAIADDPFAYGRIIRDVNGKLVKIVEEKDATDKEKQIKEINSGIYCFDNKLLFEMLEKVKNDNKQGEYYLPDVLALVREQKEIIETYLCDDFDETFGVNDRVALSYAENVMRNRINTRHMLAGVTLVDPTNTYLENAVIGNGVKVLSSTIRDSKIGDKTSVGPYSHIRNNCELGENVRVGNFVELKNTVYGEGSKTAHLSYLGDTTVGANTNIGCGTITVNYDGKNNYKTTIGSNTFIGCNSNLIAPLEIGDGAVIAAGSTVTKNVPADSLVIARAKQETKEGYAKKLPAGRK